MVIDDRLAFSSHPVEKINEVNIMLGIIRRTVVYLDPSILKPLYTALIRPHLEFNNQVGCPYLVKDVEALEDVHRRATRMVPHMKGLSYQDMPTKLKQSTLAY